MTSAVATVRNARRWGGPVGLFGLLGLGLWALGCAALTIPRVEAPTGERRIVVVVPGITGVELVDPTSQRVVWGRGIDLLRPLDGGYRLAPTRLEPGRAIRRIRLGPIVKPIYEPIERLFVENGWTTGDLAAPATGGNFFFLEYDWRRSNEESAQLLGEQLEALAAARGRELDVSLVCQSNGALICRYFAKYGRADMERAEGGRVRPAAGVRIDRLVMVGTANGGSLRVLRFLNRGRRYVPLVGRRFRPELFATFESLYQDLPVYADDLFVDERGDPVEVDLFDADTWERYGWSTHAPTVARRLAREKAAEVFAPPEERAAALAERLARALRLRRLLDRDVDLGGATYFSIQNERIPTPTRALLRSTEVGWETLFPGDGGLGEAVTGRLFTEGDGHATVASQRWLTAREFEAFGAPTQYVDGPHFEMILEPEVMERLLELALAPAREPSDPPAS